MARILTGPEPEPWQCPSCKTWIAKWQAEHKCADSDPDDGQPAMPVSGPWQPGWGTAGQVTVVTSPGVSYLP